MANFNITKAALYVGTYEKYNNGSLFGKWIQLADYDNAEAFHKACTELHKNENDPELMFQDYEHLPEALYSESYASPVIWDAINAAKGMSEDELDAFNTWLDLKENDLEFYIKRGCDLKERFTDSWQGKYDSLEDYCTHILSESGYFDCIENETLRNEIESYFDFEGYARDKELNRELEFENEHVFINLDINRSN